ncbi:DNA-directed RNA polymerase III subunit [Mycena venus]|uniref:DNA-directed RNA polymerase III subunit n=1 Tax=Mycena venus TaxID=2733690 RepID=A0A8H6TU05_9AGAR|nr:DNA-directed RNA polymerase III subunit [Mycena venus]
MRKSQYYVVEATKSTDLPRYSDKYRPSIASQPTLKKKDLYAPYFPPDIFEGYFNPKKKRKLEAKPVPTKKRMNIDEMGDEDEGEGLFLPYPLVIALMLPRKHPPMPPTLARRRLSRTTTSTRNTTTTMPRTTLITVRTTTTMILGVVVAGGADEGGGGDYD